MAATALGEVMPKREKQLQFRVTEDEYREYMDMADRADMSFSSFARQAFLLGAAQLLAYPSLRRLELDNAENETKRQ